MGAEGAAVTAAQGRDGDTPSAKGRGCSWGVSGGAGGEARGGRREGCVAGGQRCWGAAGGGGDAWRGCAGQARSDGVGVSCCGVRWAPGRDPVGKPEWARSSVLISD